MTANAKKVFSGYTQLSELEKKEVKDAIQSFDKMSFSEQQNKSLVLKNESRIMGPTSNNPCPCCGR